MPEDIKSRNLIELGMKTRREVLGDSYVDAAVAGMDDFDRDFQELLTASAWGMVWGRDTLIRKGDGGINF